MLPAAPDTAAHGADEIGLGPVAQPMGRIGRDVGTAERTERSLDLGAAGQALALVLGVRVTRHAPAGVDQIFAARAILRRRW
jgi:hypothetical protein